VLFGIVFGGKGGWVDAGEMVRLTIYDVIGVINIW